MKKLTLLSLLTACTIQAKDVNKAEVMVKAQAPDATCVDFPQKAQNDVALCTIPSSKDTYVSVYAAGHPWQVFLLKGPTPPAPAPPAPAPAPAPPAPAPAPPAAGSGSGSGAGSGSAVDGAGSGSHSK